MRPAECMAVPTPGEMEKRPGTESMLRAAPGNMPARSSLKRVQGWFAPVRLLICLLYLLGCNSAWAGDVKAKPWLSDLLGKENIRIVITDSGLGGLSVVADAAKKFQQHGVFRQVDLVFVNALFRTEGGYNSLATREEKLQVFSSALESMQERYTPDIILVACNTLSVLVPDTGFTKNSSVPVVGIVDNGIEQIAKQLASNPSAMNIMFATQTTVDEGTHKAGLLELGFDNSQLVMQSCPQLTLHIEQGFDSPYTEMLIDAYVDEALSQIGTATTPLSVSFNCTHFGYSLDAWKLAFSSRGIEVNAFLDPNTAMIDFLIPHDHRGKHESTKVTASVVSMIEIPAASIDSLGRYLDAISPLTASALQSYEQQEDLFAWRHLVSDRNP